MRSWKPDGAMEQGRFDAFFRSLLRMEGDLVAEDIRISRANAGQSQIAGGMPQPIVRAAR
jgi:hypothetical protein